MTRRTLFAVLIALSVSATSAFAADGSFDKTLSVSGNPMVSVSTGSGYIHVNAGPDNQFHVVGHVHVHSGWLSVGDPDAVVKKIVANPPITQTGSIITIGHTDNSGLFRNVSIDYDIATPRSTLLNSHTGSGEVQIAGISNAVTAGSGSGSLHLSLANSRDVHARTGSGSIHVEGAAGVLQAQTGSGSIDISGDLNSDWNLSTGSGNIRIVIPYSTRFNINAYVGSGSIHVDQPITMQRSINIHRISGTVNGGGPTLRASTGSGNITVSGTGK